MEYMWEWEAQMAWVAGLQRANYFSGKKKVDRSK